MKKQLTLVMCCLALMVTGLAQPLRQNAEREKQKPNVFQTNSEWFPKPDTHSKTTDRWVPDTITYNYNNFGNTGENRIIFSHNRNGNCTSRLHQRRDNNQWINDERYTFTYEQYNLKEELFEQWIGDEWINNQKYTYEYDTHNNLTMHILQFPDWETGVWKNSQKDSFEYDTQNNLIFHISQNTHWETGEWVNTWKETFEYDTHNNLKLLVRFNVDWETGDWVNDGKDTLEYNTQNVLIKHQYYKWNSGVWEKKKENNYYYDTHNNLKEWIADDEYGTRIRITYDYDDYNNRKEEICEGWESGQWRKQYKSDYIYDDNHNATNGLGKIGENNEWVDGFSTLMTVFYNNMKSSWKLADFSKRCGYFNASYVNTSTLSVKEKTLETHINIFPNPTNGALRIANYELPILSVELFDMMGRKQYAESRMEKEEWRMDLSNFQTGIYLLNIQTEKEIIIKKIIKY